MTDTIDQAAKLERVRTATPWERRRAAQAAARHATQHHGPDRAAVFAELVDILDLRDAL